LGGALAGQRGAHCCSARHSVEWYYYRTVRYILYCIYCTVSTVLCSVSGTWIESALKKDDTCPTSIPFPSPSVSSSRHVLPLPTFIRLSVMISHHLFLISSSPFVPLSLLSSLFSLFYSSLPNLFFHFQIPGVIPLSRYSCLPRAQAQAAHCYITRPLPSRHSTHRIILLSHKFTDGAEENIFSVCFHLNHIRSFLLQSLLRPQLSKPGPGFRSSGSNFPHRLETAPPFQFCPPHSEWPTSSSYRSIRTVYTIGSENPVVVGVLNGQQFSVSPERELWLGGRHHQPRAKGRSKKGAISAFR